MNKFTIIPTKRDDNGVLFIYDFQIWKRTDKPCKTLEEAKTVLGNNTSCEKVEVRGNAKTKTLNAFVSQHGTSCILKNDHFYQSYCKENETT
ncbi:MAG: hypothetical protein LBL47_00645 [Lactobacillus sp.]|jgi:hypothetical protein|nr:hypothetical protein [Lactobacillus sp.]